jgi:hypothetical protein
MERVRQLFAAATLLIAFASVAQAAESVAWYKITKSTASVGQTRPPGNTDLLVEAPFGSWNGFIALPEGTRMPVGKSIATLQFEFMSPNYFSDTNIGHFAIAVRGDIKGGLQGRGVVIGNVTGLPPANATTIRNTTATESFWLGGNHVYGPTTQGIALQNNVWYRMNVISHQADAGGIWYVLEKKRTDGSWESVVNRAIVDGVGLGKVPANYGGWFIAEVFSEHAWTMHLKNVNWTYKN